MKTTTISILRSKIKSYIDGVIKDDEPVLVNKGANGVVIVSLDYYNLLISGKALDQRIPRDMDPSRNDYFVDVNIDEL